MKQLTRRHCLAALAGAAVTPAARVLGANGDIRIGMVGLGRRAPDLFDWFGKVPGVRLVAVAECDSEPLGKRMKELEQRDVKVRGVIDYRRLLDDRDIDAVVVATPDHWHSLMTVQACRAGKDVYVEKPISHNIWEGGKAVEAARKYRRIVAAGMQNRSDKGLLEAFEFLRQGGLGRILLARAFNYPGDRRIGKTDGPQPIPPTLDYNLFQGPAPLLPPRRKNLHYDWHFFWDTGTGDTANRGVHEIDHTRWLVQSGWPERVTAIAGRLGWNDDGETPNEHVVYFDCKPVPVLWEMRSLRVRSRLSLAQKLGARGDGSLLECEGGYLTGGRGGAAAWDRSGKLIRKFPGDSGVTHAANFIEAVRSRRMAHLRTPIAEGHITAAMCHMANIAYRIGYRRTPAEIAASISGNAVLSESFERLASDLKAGGLDLDSERLTLGPVLEWDANAEQFTGETARWANMYLSRLYRPPFVMPRKV